MVGEKNPNGADAQQRATWINLVSLWLAVALAFGAFAGFAYDLLHSFERRTALAQSERRELRQQIGDHERTATEWKDRIILCEKRLGELATDALSRPDPFTGTQGTAMERRIDQLERGSEAVTYLRDRVEDMQTELRNSISYYQRQVLPLLEQSNSLQLQRNHGMGGN